MFRTALPIAAIALCLAAPAQAAGEISIPRTVPYASNAIGSAAIRKQCSWNSELSTTIVQNAGGKVVAVDTLPATGKVLDIRITYVHAPGGGAWSGPKWGKIEAVLKDNDNVIATLSARRTTGIGGRTCDLLSRVAEALGEDVAKWLEDPKDIIQTEGRS